VICFRRGICIPPARWYGKVESLHSQADTSFGHAADRALWRVHQAALLAVRKGVAQAGAPGWRHWKADVWERTFALRRAINDS
jgi:hypothetical protein